MQADAEDKKGKTSREEREPTRDEWVARRGCGLMFYLAGILVAAAWSFRMNHSLLLGALHGSLSWLYVVYRLLFA